MPTSRLDEHWDYETEVQRLIEELEETIRLSKIVLHKKQTNR